MSSDVQYSISDDGTQFYKNNEVINFEESENNARNDQRGGVQSKSNNNFQNFQSLIKSEVSQFINRSFDNILVLAGAGPSKDIEDEAEIKKLTLLNAPTR